jgi:hypothetical protein
MSFDSSDLQAGYSDSPDDGEYGNVVLLDGGLVMRKGRVIQSEYGEELLEWAEEEDEEECCKRPGTREERGRAPEDMVDIYDEACDESDALRICHNEEEEEEYEDDMFYDLMEEANLGDDDERRGQLEDAYDTVQELRNLVKKKEDGEEVVLKAIARCCRYIQHLFQQVLELPRSLRDKGDFNEKEQEEWDKERRLRDEFIANGGNPSWFAAVAPWMKQVLQARLKVPTDLPHCVGDDPKDHLSSERPEAKQEEFEETEEGEKGMEKEQEKSKEKAVMKRSSDMSKEGERRGKQEQESLVKERNQKARSEDEEEDGAMKGKWKMRKKKRLKDGSEGCEKKKRKRKGKKARLRAKRRKEEIIMKKLQEDARNEEKWFCEDERKQEEQATLGVPRCGLFLNNYMAKAMQPADGTPVARSEVLFQEKGQEPGRKEKTKERNGIMKCEDNNGDALNAVNREKVSGGRRNGKWKKKHWKRRRLRPGETPRKAEGRIDGARDAFEKVITVGNFRTGLRRNAAGELKGRQPVKWKMCVVDGIRTGTRKFENRL